MSTNNTSVITAQRFHESALAAQLHLQEQYDLPKGHQDPTRIAALHQRINYGLKSAEVSALIAIAEGLHALNDVPEFDVVADSAMRLVRDDDL